MRFIGLALSVVLLASAFIVGRVTAPQAASASMLVPAVTTFSHFECYTSGFGTAPGAVISLTDQFQSYQTKLGPPELFCTPVTKKVISGPHFKPPPPADHLTCYMISGPQIQQSRPYANQFVKQDQVSVGTPSLLCVPTHKTG
ncbi:MAG: hypothetical protein JO190_12640 [Candidatus Eremiobacteraeota bacterium]|nr:hypothetical protein [Candidatus Eremiobacteraeota bacterium]MBV8499324.1 hypothetical protein [Candidatus Eremiobacteraeota bacterium]